MPYPQVSRHPGESRGPDKKRQRPPQAPEFLEIRLTDLALSGESYAEVKGETIYVDGAIPGERVRVRILDRAARTVESLELESAIDTFATTYACPLFEPGTGCLVHSEAKPAPCIHHGCYEAPEHLPDEASRIEVERTVAELNREVYGADESQWGYLTIPVWMTRLTRHRRVECESADAD